MAVGFNQAQNQYVAALAEGARYAWRNRDRIRREVEYWRNQYRRSRKNAGMSGPPAGPMGPSLERVSNQELGAASTRIYGCTTRSGDRRRPVSLKRAVKELLVRNAFMFQSLNWSRISANYRVNGSYQLRAQFLTGTATTWPRSVLYPVYVFRLSAPGNGRAVHSGSVESQIDPTIAYRLRGSQDIEDGLWTFTWEEAPPSNNLQNIGYGDLSTDTTLNKAAVIELEAAFESGRICHESSDIQILYTGATTVPTDVSACIVRFDESDHAPPDVAQDGWIAGPPRAPRFVTIRENSLFSDVSDNRLRADKLNAWLHGKMSHPCAQQGRLRGLPGPPLWRESSKFTKTLCARDLMSADTNAVQYLHRHLMYPKRWYDCVAMPPAVPPVDGANEVTLNLVSVQNTVGVFPPVEQQQWLMVTGFARNPIAASGLAFSNTIDASFDISIRSMFCASAE